MIAIAAAITLVVLRAPVGRLIDNIAHLKLPGGTELTASQQRRTDPELGSGPEPLASPPDEDDLRETSALLPEQAAAIVKSERAAATLWEYRYLNMYLVRTTQTVLDWFETQSQPVTRSLVDSQLQARVPDAGERTAIMAALLNYRLLQQHGELVEIAPKGREYIKWRGLLPPLAG